MSEPKSLHEATLLLRDMCGVKSVTSAMVESIPASVNEERHAAPMPNNPEVDSVSAFMKAASAAKQQEDSDEEDKADQAEDAEAGGSAMVHCNHHYGDGDYVVVDAGCASVCQCQHK